MANRLHREEWRALAILAYTIGYEWAWREQERRPGHQASQETIDSAALSAMAKSALVGHHVDNAPLARCWQHNFYRGARGAETGSPNGPLYPGWLAFEAIRPEPDDYKPKRGKARADARE